MNSTDYPPDLLLRDLGHGLTLRMARPEEYKDIGLTLLGAFDTNGPMTDQYRHRLLSIDERAHDADIWVIAGDDGQIYGAYTTPHPQTVVDRTFGFNTMGVHPRGRGLGLGKAFVEHSIGLAQYLGLEKLLIYSGPNMPFAHELYRRCGFVRHKELETRVVDGGQRLLAFVYELAA